MNIATFLLDLLKPSRRSGSYKAPPKPPAPAARRDAGDRMMQEPFTIGLRRASNEVACDSLNRHEHPDVSTGLVETLAGAAAQRIEPRQPSAPAATARCRRPRETRFVDYWRANRQNHATCAVKIADRSMLR